MKRLLELLRQVENYQEIELPDGEILTGKRSVDDRYKMIKPHLRDGLYFDIGSNHGGFSRRIARDFNSVVVSFEANHISAEIQKTLLEMHGINNVILINSPFSLSTMRQILWPIELIDGFLFLNILHHFDPDQGIKILENSSSRIPDTFVELPNDFDVAACGHGSTIRLNDALSKLNFKELGTSKSHTGKDRVLSLRSNEFIEGNAQSYWGSPREGEFKRNFVFFSELWSINGLDYKPATGINLWNVLQMGNILHPSREVMSNMAKTAYEKAIETYPHVEDIRPWNLIFTPNGMEVIDFSDRMNGEDDYTLAKLQRSILGETVDWEGK